jgi:peroxiredoxin
VLEFITGLKLNRPNSGPALALKKQKETKKKQISTEKQKGSKKVLTSFPETDAACCY